MKRGSYHAKRRSVGMPHGTPRDEARRFWSARQYHGEAYTWSVHAEADARRDEKRRAKAAKTITKIRAKIA